MSKGKITAIIGAGALAATQVAELILYAWSHPGATAGLWTALGRLLPVMGAPEWLGTALPLAGALLVVYAYLRRAANAVEE